MQKNKNTYDAPAITVVEVKACGRMCTGSDARLLILGSDSSNGIQQFTVNDDTLNW